MINKLREVPSKERLIAESGVPAVETKPSFITRFILYFTLGLLWVMTFFGVLFLTVIIKIGSRQSYVGDSIDEHVWAVLISALGSYTIGTSLYVGMRGYQARFGIILLMNSVLIISFALSVLIQAIIVFYSPS